jgi:hypothetical protein
MYMVIFGYPVYVLWISSSVRFTLFRIRVNCGRTDNKTANKKEEIKRFQTTTLENMKSDSEQHE